MASMGLLGAMLQMKDLESGGDPRHERKRGRTRAVITKTSLDGRAPTIPTSPKTPPPAFFTRAKNLRRIKSLRLFTYYLQEETLMRAGLAAGLEPLLDIQDVNG